MDPESTGPNPAWRGGLISTILVTTWPEGANETQINAARQCLIQEKKILEDIAPRIPGRTPTR